MGTSKEMKLKIIDKMRKNIEDNIHMMSGIEYEVVGKWYEVKKSLAHVFNMNVTKYRLKPETITINGVDIPKPLKIEDVRDFDKNTNYYIVCCSSTLYDVVCIRYMNIHKPMFSYLTKEEAIEASKALFGIK